jgi:hypothetical protein
MSKKHKRQSRNVSANSKPAAAITTPAPAAVKNASTYEFNPDYSYVKRDLKRIAILAVSFIIILVVISFYLR